MNWYKISQEIIEQKVWDNNPDVPNYNQIGHYREDKGDIMWIWYQGRLGTIGATYSHTHDSRWRTELDNFDNLYRGRYAPDSQDVTILVPDKPMMSQRPIPNILIKALTREFGDNIKIHAYRF